MDRSQGTLPAHSPLGASGAYRWMVCPGSISLSHGIEDEESDFAALGTAAHTLGEHCLTKNVEPWSLIGCFIDGDVLMLDPPGDEAMYIPVDKEMADAVATYIACLDSWHPDRNQGNFWVERGFHCPDIHEWFYGRSDATFLTRRGDEYIDHDTGEFVKSKLCILDTWDYKHGVGIVVEADDNPQLMYYAAGMLEDLGLWDEVDLIRVHIYQPRGWHWKGPHRYAEITPDELDAWLNDVCVPAMKHAEVSRDTKTGDHCRFCPARQGQCPALMNDMIEYQELLMIADKEGVDKLTPEQLGHLLNLHDLGKIVAKAAGKAAHGYLANGHDVPGVKLVKSRTNREHKDGAEAAAIKTFGKRKAFTDPKLKSPAQIDEMPGGKAFTARWAYKPEGGTTVATEKDPRRAIKRDAKSLFKPVKKEA